MSVAIVDGVNIKHNSKFVTLLMYSSTLTAKQRRFWKRSICYIACTNFGFTNSKSRYLLIYLKSKFIYCTFYIFNCNIFLGSNLGTKTVPPPRPESPSPALPPKKAKQPPPRPAPPRPIQVF